MIHAAGGRQRGVRPGRSDQTKSQAPVTSGSALPTTTHYASFRQL